MHFEIGTPRPLASLKVKVHDMANLKRNFQIAIVDDEPFGKAKALTSHRFNLIELGDIRTVDQVAEYPIVVCDIRGVGRSLDASLEGAHLIHEIRKAYPDKFLVSYSGARFDIGYNEALKSADVSLAKDEVTEHWVQTLERGLRTVGDPKQRWLRLRSTLLNKGVELHDILQMEQRFIKAIERQDASQFMADRAPDTGKDLVITFARIALVQIIRALAS